MTQVQYPKLPNLKTGSRVYKGKSYYYIQTYTSHYDYEKKYSVSDSQKTVGVIKGGEKYGEIEFKEEFIAEYPNLKYFKTFKTKEGLIHKLIDEDIFTVTNPLKVTKVIGGATWAINHAMAQLGIGDALRNTFGQYRRDLKFASIINYMIQMQTCVMHHYEPFAKIHWLPWVKPLNDSQINHLFKTVTQDDIFNFFKSLNNGYTKKISKDFYKRMFIALDSTSISTYSDDLSQADKGHNKDGDLLKQINYLMVCDESTGSLIYGKTYKGNVVDVSTVERLTADLKIIFNEQDYDFKPNLIFVTDRGYDSKDNLHNFLINDYSFVMRAARIELNTWVSDVINECMEDLKDENNYDIFTGQFLYSKTVRYWYDPFPVAGKKASNKSCKNLHVNMVFNEQIYNENKSNLRNNIGTAREEYNKKVQEIYDTCEEVTPQILSTIKIDSDNQKYINKYCVFDKDGFAIIDKNKVQEKLKYVGIMALISDCIKDPMEAYFVYKQRQRVEKNFEIHKSVLNFNRPYCSNDRAFQGKFLCEMIATSIATLFDTRLREYEKTEDAKKDKIRITAYSLKRIINELNTIMLTQFKNGYYFDEIAGKYKYLYKALGIPLPEDQYKYTNELSIDYSDEEPYETPDEEMQSIAGEEL